MPTTYQKPIYNFSKTSETSLHMSSYKMSKTKLKQIEHSAEQKLKSMKNRLNRKKTMTARLAMLGYMLTFNRHRFWQLLGEIPWELRQTLVESGLRHLPGPIGLYDRTI